MLNASSKKRKTWTAEEQSALKEIIIKAMPMMPAESDLKKLADQLGRSLASVTHRCFRTRLWYGEVSKNKCLWGEDEREIIRNAITLHSPSTPAETICAALRSKLPGRSFQAILTQIYSIRQAEQAANTPLSPQQPKSQLGGISSNQLSFGDISDNLVNRMTDKLREWATTYVLGPEFLSVVTQKLEDILSSEIGQDLKLFQEECEKLEAENKKLKEELKQYEALKEAAKKIN